MRPDKVAGPSAHIIKSRFFLLFSRPFQQLLRTTESDWSREPPDRAYCKGAGSRYRHHFVVYGGKRLFGPESRAHIRIFHPGSGSFDGRASRRKEFHDRRKQHRSDRCLGRWYTFVRSPSWLVSSKKGTRQRDRSGRTALRFLLVYT